jgi:hypothetical protein
MSKVMTGARAKVFIDDVLVAIYESCSYGANVGVEPIHTLGRFSAHEITPTSYEAVVVNCSGFRIVGNGIHTLPKVPKVQDLLDLENVKISISDRQSGENIMTVINCVGNAYNTNLQARATTRVQVTYTGTILSDEDGDQTEGRDAVDLP